MSRRSAVVAAASAAVATRRALADPRLVRAAGSRTNFRGRSVSLVAGPAAAAGVVVGGTAGAIASSSPTRLLAVVAAGGTAGGAGWYDDTRAERSVHAKGLRGHLGALAHGNVTTGAVKLGVLAAGGYAAGRVLGHGRADALARGALIAGTANLINLLDLRPGRAAKATCLLGGALIAVGGDGAPLAGAAVGAAAAVLGGDLAEHTMLGDTGANALGATLGVGLASGRSAAGRLLALAAVTGLTLASERVSFTAVIERQPVLSRIDSWGREGVAE